MLTEERRQRVVLEDELTMLKAELPPSKSGAKFLVRVRQRGKTEVIAMNRCEVCQRDFRNLATHQVLAKHGRLWEARRDETASAKKRRLSQERCERRNAQNRRKRQLALEAT